MSDEVRFVRLKPYDEKAGFVVRDFTQRFGGQFVRFREAGTWYEVPAALAEQLAKARQIPQRSSSPPVFDVCTEREARGIDAVAEKVREEAKAVVEPSVDTARKVVVDDTSGRGDLSLEEVTAGRTAALDATSARAAGEELPPHRPTGRHRKRKKS